MRYTISLLTALLLVSASVLGVVGHDFASESQAEVVCVGDHSEPGVENQLGSAHSGEPRLETSGEEHQHLCLACHFSRDRTLGLPEAETYERVGDAVGGLPSLSIATVETTLTGITPRGPPSYLA